MSVRNGAKPIRSARLAAMLLPWAVLLLAPSLGGCLLPQDDNVLPFIPSPKNLPPIIVGHTPIQQVTTFQYGVNCNAPEFTISVDDDSPSVKHRWFIDPTSDYRPGDGHPAATGFGPFGGVSGKPRSLRAPNDIIIELQKRSDGDTVALEAVITDGDFGQSSTGGLSYQSVDTGFDELGNPVPQEVFHTSFTWFLTILVRACQ